MWAESVRTEEPYIFEAGFGPYFDIPTINSDEITIEYNSFKKLLNDIKNTKLSYFYLDKKNKFEKKNYFKFLEKEYKKNYFNGKYILNIKFNIISAWKR